MKKRFLKWGEIDFPWFDIKRSDDDFMIWSDISLIIEEVEKIVRGGGSEFYNDSWRKISKEIGKEKTEKFIKVFCTVNNIEYERGKFLKEGIKVEASQFEKVFKKVKIKINI